MLSVKLFKYAVDPGSACINVIGTQVTGVTGGTARKVKWDYDRRQPMRAAPVHIPSADKR